MLTPTLLALFVVAGDSGYSDAELARICAADVLAERDRRRMVEEYARELTEVVERQWEPWRCEMTGSQIHETKNGG